MNLMFGCFTKKYALFSGRARRKEFWLFMLAAFILGIIAQIIEANADLYYLAADIVPVGILTTVLSLALLIPYAAAAVRRLHDTNRSWLWLLMLFLPAIVMLFIVVIQPILMNVITEESSLYITFISMVAISALLFIPMVVIQLVGVIWLLVLFMLKGTVGENRFGPDPLALESDETLKAS